MAMPAVNKNSATQPPFRPSIAGNNNTAFKNGESPATASRPQESPSSAQSDLILIPSYSRWFSWKNIHDCEVRNLPEFFDGKSAVKNPRVYKYYRNSVIQRFRENPTRKITFTGARKTIIGDVGSVRRVFDFLEAWGLINYLGAKSQKLEDKDASKSSLINNNNNQVAAGAVAAVNDGGVAAVNDFTGSRKRFCSICKSVCSIACFARDKDDVTLCARCFVRGSYKVGPSTSDFKRVEITDEEKSDWTDKETLHLLEAVMHYRDDWKRVAEHVTGRTAKECVSHFVKLSFGEEFIGPLDSSEFNDDVHRSTSQSGSESVLPSVTGSPAKRMRLSPLADASNPIMAQAAFLSALVGVDVAEAAAHAAVWALYDGLNGTNIKENTGSRTGDGTRQQDSEPCLSSDHNTTTNVSTEAFEEAQLQLKKEETDLEKSISDISVQMQEFQNKIIHFEKFDLEVEKESQHLEQLKNLLFADQLALLFHKNAGAKSHLISEKLKGQN